MSKQTVIVSGGMVEKDFALSILKSEETEFVIGVDRGLVFLYDNEIKPDYIVGDFDSVPRKLVEYYREELDVPVREFNPVKDASDTEIALRLCLGLNRKKIVILGATGNRIDHLIIYIPLFSCRVILQFFSFSNHTKTTTRLPPRSEPCLQDSCIPFRLITEIRHKYS